MSLTVMKTDFIIGIDIGQIVDSTGIALIERFRAVPDLANLHEGWHERAKKEARAIPMRMDLVDMERIPQGVTYPQQLERIRQFLSLPGLRGMPVYIDATGVGRGPFDFLRASGVRNLHTITITSSTGPAKQTPDGWNVGKAELVNAVQIEMQTERLRIGKQIPYASDLIRELMDFRQHQNPTTGHVTFNARSGQHDDLVLALSYAVFGALRPTPVTNFPIRWAA